MRKFNAWPLCLLAFLLAVVSADTFAQATALPVPPAVRSGRFRVTVNGRRTWFLHAASNYYFLNFDSQGKARIEITAPEDNYWKGGVEVQPWRLGIRPRLRGRTISFTVDGPAKLSISRPGDHFARAEMLFVFANPPEAKPPQANDPDTIYFKPGIYHQSINPHSGQNVYLAPGAIVYGALNVWQVENVRVYGRGVIIYDGPQDPTTDQGWMHKPDWHGIVMDNARNIEIDGITVVVRSRTWMAQMWHSHHLGFNNVKIIGGSKGDANQDGMDFLGSGEIAVRNVFLRAADDDFAIEGDNDFYTTHPHVHAGVDVDNITIENSVVSTSVSNTVRVSWPLQRFNSHNFLMRNMDVIHTGFGSCGVPFGLIALWADEGGSGEHSNYRFEDVRLEDWYSLLQIYQQRAAVHDIAMDGIWALGSPSMAPSALSGSVSGVRLSGVQIADHPVTSNADLPLKVESGAEAPDYTPARGQPSAKFSYTAGILHPQEAVRFEAAESEGGAAYHWLFGDGSQATGRIVVHRFADTMGTLLDHSGSFRVLLHVVNVHGHEAWSEEPVIVGVVVHSAPGQKTGQGMDVQVPADGGYTFTLLSGEKAALKIDGFAIASTPAPKPLVCGTPGNAVQPGSGGIQLRAGMHRIEVSGAEHYKLDWQGPGLELQRVPGSPQ